MGDVFTIILNVFTWLIEFSLSFLCEIFTDVYKVNIRITVKLLVAFQEEHLLNWNSLGLLYHTYIFSKNHFWVSYMINQAFEEYLIVHVWYEFVLDFIALFVLKLQSFDHKMKHVILLFIHISVSIFTKLHIFAHFE